ncbi:MAG: family 16 glycosylhydrolase [Clostridia bacterium]|nr:family 16 glycosylhydrolase [Clostridia bacterium]
MSTIAIPQAAEKAGYRNLVFYDDFDDAATVDWKDTRKPGFNWYIDRPFNWPSLVDGDVTMKESVLTVAQEQSCANWGVGSYSAHGDTGHAYRYGYFEARIRFDVTKNKKDVSGFPAWWCFSVAHTTDRNDEHWSELDFFEAMTNPTAGDDYTGTYVATVHDWVRDGNPINHQNPNNWHDKVVTEGWHDYGCLWKPGVFEWYYDGELLSRVTYAADSRPEPANENNFEGCYSFMETETMMLILGSCKEWPMDVDWVRVWQE